MGSLEELITDTYYKSVEGSRSAGVENNAYHNVKKIVNQLAEEYMTCYKSCTECEAYDKEKHYCPKWCDVIKNTAKELAEEYNNDFCEWEKVVIDSTELMREPHRMYLFKKSDDKWEYCPYCGKKIKVVG